MSRPCLALSFHLVKRNHGRDRVSHITIPTKGHSHDILGFLDGLLDGVLDLRCFRGVFIPYGDTDHDTSVQSQGFAAVWSGGDQYERAFARLPKQDRALGSRSVCALRGSRTYEPRTLLRCIHAAARRRDEREGGLSFKK